MVNREEGKRTRSGRRTTVCAMKQEGPENEMETDGEQMAANGREATEASSSSSNSGNAYRVPRPVVYPATVHTLFHQQRCAAQRWRLMRDDARNWTEIFPQRQ